MHYNEAQKKITTTEDKHFETNIAYSRIESKMQYERHAMHSVHGAAAAIIAFWVF